MKPAIVIVTVIIAIIAIVIGLIAYSYTQIQFSLESISYKGLDVSLTGGSIVKTILNGIMGNWLGAVLDLITGVKLGLGFALSNHGFFPVYIPDVSYDLLVNDVKVGQGQSHIDKTINPGETKSIEDIQDIQFSSLKPAAASVIDSGGLINFKIRGTAYFSFLGLSVPVPFETTKQVNIVDELKSKLLGSRSQSSEYSNNSYQSPPVTGTDISIQASAYTATQGQTVTFTGRLTDSNGNGISNQLVYVKRDISFAPDSVLGSSYTDSNGYFSIDWPATKPITSNTANVYATFEGSSGYSSVRGSDISIQIYSQQTQPTTQNSQSSLDQQLQQARQNTQSTQQNSQTQTSTTIANNIYKVGPGTYTYIPFNLSCQASVSGSFSAQAALGNNIITMVLDQNNFQLMTSNQQISAYYDSGKVSSGSFNLTLPPGQYYIVLSNTYSSFSTKTVSMQAYASCS